MSAVKNYARKDGSLTHEHFQLQEFIQVAQLRTDGLSNEEILTKAKEENIFQFPTKTQIPVFTRGMLNRLDSLESNALIELAAEGPRDQAALVNLYAMMRIYNVIATFMVDEVAERYLTLNYNIDATDLNAFITRYRSENSEAGKWTDSTAKRIRSVLIEVLVRAGYLANHTSTELFPVYADDALLSALRRNGNNAWLPCFNDCSEVC